MDQRKANISHLSESSHAVETLFRQLIILKSRINHKIVRSVLTDICQNRPHDYVQGLIRNTRGKIIMRHILTIKLSQTAQQLCHIRSQTETKAFECLGQETKFQWLHKRDFYGFRSFRVLQVLNFVSFHNSRKWGSETWLVLDLTCARRHFSKNIKSFTIILYSAVNLSLFKINEE